CCGEVLDPNNLAWDNWLPDDLADLSDEERSERIVFESRVFIVANGYGTAARVILPITLDTGHTVTLGVWMSPDDPETMGETAREGGDPWIGYAFTGKLLNAVHPWPETSHTKITAQGFADRELARVVDAEDPVLKRVLTEKWPHRVVVDARGA
ncbi:MAG: hypothetical protein QOF58_1992, partial [Pseudonocardiales bacterium]|nr:hypothetical protein [Pseudonocardiales bacterium]